MIVAAAICAAIGLLLLGALIGSLVGANHHPHPEPITPALHAPDYEPWTEDERAWDLQLTGRDNPWPFDQTVD